MRTRRSALTFSGWVRSMTNEVDCRSSVASDRRRSCEFELELLVLCRRCLPMLTSLGSSLAASLAPFDYFGARPRSSCNLIILATSFTLGDGSETQEALSQKISEWLQPRVFSHERSSYTRDTISSNITPGQSRKWQIAQASLFTIRSRQAFEGRRVAVEEAANEPRRGSLRQTTSSSSQ